MIFVYRELEKFMSYGFFHCLDSFLFIYTFLPLRVTLAVVTVMFRAPLIYFGYVQSFQVLGGMEILAGVYKVPFYGGGEFYQYVGEEYQGNI